MALRSFEKRSPPNSAVEDLATLKRLSVWQRQAGHLIGSVIITLEGFLAYDDAQPGLLPGVASFHGLFMPPGNTAGNTIKAKVLALHGHQDPMVPVDAVLNFEKELVEAGADWQIHVYGNAIHSFTNPAANDASFGTMYDADSDRRSWQTLLNFLDEVLS